jgi:hypothetical protein
MIDMGLNNPFFEMDTIYSFDNPLFEWDDEALCDSSDEMGFDHRIWDPGADSSGMVLSQDREGESNFRNDAAVHFSISSHWTTIYVMKIRWMVSSDQQLRDWWFTLIARDDLDIGDDFPANSMLPTRMISGGFHIDYHRPCSSMLLIMTSVHGQTDFGLLQAMVQLVVGDFPDGVWMFVVGWVCWSIRSFRLDTLRLSVVDAFSICGHKGFSWMSDFRDGFVDIFYTIPLTVSDQLHFRSDMRRYVKAYMLWLGRFSLPLPKIEFGKELADFDFPEIHLQDVILDSGDGSSRHYSLGLGVEDTIYA